MNKLTDKLREGDKLQEANLLYRFAQGTYPGVPYTKSAKDEDSEGNDDARSSGSGKYRWTFILLLLALVAYSYFSGRALSMEQEHTSGMSVEE